MLLQRAHAAHLQAACEALVSEPGNPLEAEGITIGETRVFATNQNRLENRVLLTGNETTDELDRIFEYFDQRRVKAFIELNPANFLRTRPFSWQSELVGHLVNRGCHIDAFRCVWYLSGGPDTVPPPRIERYDHTRFDEFSTTLDAVYAPDMAAEADWTRRTQRGSQWLHYVGFEAERPVSTGTLFVGEQLGYLAWWYTNPGFRSHGHQTAGIRARAADAFLLGCEGVFTVADFDTQSSINLQRAGFRLAYNYLLLTRDPTLPREVVADRSTEERER